MSPCVHVLYIGVGACVGVIQRQLTKQKYAYHTRSLQKLVGDDETGADPLIASGFLSDFTFVVSRAIYIKKFTMPPGNTIGATSAVPCKTYHGSKGNY